MGRNKNYSGYSAYQYLAPGRDYVETKFRDEIVKEWSYLLPLSRGEEERFEEIMEKSIIVDLHEHPVKYPQDIEAERRLMR